ncbi:zinc knuckle CX2CX4HX4C containing protein [Tanacetum coccineum]
MLKNGLWFLRNNPLILKKWLPDVNLLKEDVGIVPVWVKLHGVPVMTFSEDELSVIATKLSTLIMLDSYTGNKKKNVEPTKEVSKSNSFDVLTSIENDVKLGTNGGTSQLASQAANYSRSSFWNVDYDSPRKPLKKVDDDSDDKAGSVDNEMASFLAKKDGYGQEIPEKLQAFCDNLDIKVRVVSVPPTVVTPTVEMTNDGFQTVGKKKNKGKTKSTNGGQFGGYSVKQTVRYEPKATTSVIVASNKEGNITMSNSYAALDYESEEDVENIYDESANLLHSTQTAESSSTFMVVAVHTTRHGLQPENASF